MVAADDRNGHSVSPENAVAIPSVHKSKLLRAIVAFIVGMLITFSGTMHEALAFDRGVIIASFVLFAAAHLFAWWQARSADSKDSDPVSLILAVVSFAGAIIVPFTQTPASLAAVIAAWALVQGLLEFIGGVTRPGSRQDATILGAVGILLAIAVLLVFRDPVAIIGFFGAYALIVGVLLGISAFDTRGTRDALNDYPQKAQND